MSKLLAGVVLTAAISFGGSGAARAVNFLDFTFTTTAVAQFTPSPLGTVHVSKNGTGLDFTVTLGAGYAFRFAPDSNHWDLAFNLPTLGHTITGLTPTMFFQAPGSSFNASPFGNFNYAVDCRHAEAGHAAVPARGKRPAQPAVPATPGCLPGTSAGNPTTMAFSIAGASLTHLLPKPYQGKAIYFAADVVNGAGNTGNIGATLTSPTFLGIPEPATWAMMLMGFGGMGAVLRRNRRQARAALA